MKYIGFFSLVILIMVGQCVAVPWAVEVTKAYFKIGDSYDR